MKEKSLGMHITEYKHDDYDNIINNYNSFYVVSQFVKKLERIEDLQSVSAQGRVKPQCLTGEVLYGVEPNGDLTELMAVIDSSG